LYTSPSTIMYSPFSTVLCSATCLVVSDSDMVEVLWVADATATEGSFGV
jgi:hypothetical protein